MKRPIFLKMAAVLMVCLLGPGAQAQAKPRKHRVKKARRYRFDGFRLEDSFQKVFRKSPYSKPCDDDPVDNRKRKAMVYGGLACRGRSFPKATTVVFLVEMKKGRARRLHAPIKAFAFMGGRYFATKTKFPIHPGDSTSKAKSVLGSPKAVRALGRRRLILMVWKYRRDVRLLISGSQVVGAVFGEMPTNLKNEQWEVIYEMYRRYTPKPKRKLKKMGKGSAATLCKRVWKKVWRCRHKSRLAARMAKDKKVFPQKCIKKARAYPAIMRCIARSTCRSMSSCVPK